MTGSFLSLARAHPPPACPSGRAIPCSQTFGKLALAQRELPLTYVHTQGGRLPSKVMTSSLTDAVVSSSVLLARVRLGRRRRLGRDRLSPKPHVRDLGRQMALHHGREREKKGREGGEEPGECGWWAPGRPRTVASPHFVRGRRTRSRRDLPFARSDSHSVRSERS